MYRIYMSWLVVTFQAPEADYLDAAVVSVLQIHLTQPQGDVLVSNYHFLMVNLCSYTMYTLYV